LAQATPSTPQIVPVKGMGPGFIPVTIVMTIINVAVALAVCYLPLDFLLPSESNPASDSAVSIDWLFKFMTVFGVAITVYVSGYVAYFAWVFRRRPDEDINTVGVPIHDAPKLEFWWTVLPTILLIILMYLTIVAWKQIQFPTTAAALTTEVVAHQFYFEFRYPGMQGAVYSPKGEMHLPEGKPVKILVSAGEGDVIHQFWVPEFRLKIAAVPGMVTQLNLTPTRLGRYDITCSEYCGKNHSIMQAKLVVDTPADFDKWLAQARVTAAASGPAIALNTGVADTGKALFAQKCSACHSVAGGFDTKIVGPGLLHITDDPAHPKLVDGKAPTPEDIEEILVKGYVGPIGAMPNRQANGLSDADIANLVAYLVSLK
jgi:cytochrome c oxidase subunit 2